MMPEGSTFACEHGKRGRCLGKTAISGSVTIGSHSCRWLPPPDFTQIKRSLLDTFPFDLWLG